MSDRNELPYHTRRVQPWEATDYRDSPSSVYGHWHDDKSGRWFVADYLTWSDYSGSTCERSNYETWCETFKSGEGKWWIDVHGGHGTRAVLIRTLAYRNASEVREFLDGLEGYPVADENAMSDLEMRLQEEAWTDWAARDLQHELRDYAAEQGREDLSEAFDDDDLPWSDVLGSELWNQDYDREAGRYVSELANARSHDEPHCEDAVSCWFPIDRWVRGRYRHMPEGKRGELSIAYLETLVRLAREKKANGA